MKEKEYEVIAHIEDDDDIVEVCNEDYMIEWINAFIDEEEVCCYFVFFIFHYFISIVSFSTCSI
jgi:hypothetical protein